MILVLTGPTGSGKSALAISLARKLNAAIVNADAFQVYQELGVATAKPSVEERSLAPHFLFDFVPITQDYDVYEYQSDLRRTLKELSADYPHIIIAGGTGLYIRSALFDYDFASGEPVDLSRFDSLSNEELHDELVKVDPRSGEKIHPNNRRRVLRALEIYLSTGISKSELEAKQSHAPIYDCRFYGLKRERDDLFSVCDERVETMFEHGLLEENKGLIEKYGRSPRAFQAIGVKETFPYFDGEITLSECKGSIKLNTRHYVKRQMTFFAHQFDLKWIQTEDDVLVDF